MIDSLNEDVFLLAIEPLHKKGPAISKRLSLRDIDQGVSFELSVPKGVKNIDYGISLCFDFKKSQECASKPILLAREWKTLLASIRHNDRIFYYQMMSVSRDRAYFIPSQKWDAKAMQKLKTSVRDVLENPASIDSLKANVQKLSPIPAKVSGSPLELLLPARHTKCL